MAFDPAQQEQKQEEKQTGFDASSKSGGDCTVTTVSLNQSPKKERKSIKIKIITKLQHLMKIGLSDDDDMLCLVFLGDLSFSDDSKTARVKEESFANFVQEFVDFTDKHSFNKFCELHRMFKNGVAVLDVEDVYYFAVTAYNDRVGDEFAQDSDEDDSSDTSSDSSDGNGDGNGDQKQQDNGDQKQQYKPDWQLSNCPCMKRYCNAPAILFRLNQIKSLMDMYNFKYGVSGQSVDTSLNTIAASGGWTVDRLFTWYDYLNFSDNTDHCRTCKDQLDMMQSNHSRWYNDHRAFLRSLLDSVEKGKDLRNCDFYHLLGLILYVFTGKF